MHHITIWLIIVECEEFYYTFPHSGYYNHLYRSTNQHKNTWKGRTRLYCMPVFLCQPCERIIDLWIIRNGQGYECWSIYSGAIMCTDRCVVRIGKGCYLSRQALEINEPPYVANFDYMYHHMYFLPILETYIQSVKLIWDHWLKVQKGTWHCDHQP